MYVTGTSTNWSTNSWSTVTKWWDDTYLYIRTDRWSYTTTYQWTYYSSGAWRMDGPFTAWTHTWDTVRQLLLDWSSPIHLPTPKPGPPQQPGLDNGVASPSGTCGSGGDPSTCITATATGALPPRGPPRPSTPNPNLRQRRRKRQLR